MSKRKLTYATAQQIRDYKRANPFASAQAILRVLSLQCSETAVWHILKGRTYTSRIQRCMPRVVLTAEQVRDIRARAKANPHIRNEVWAVQYKVAASTIGDILRFKTWKHLPLAIREASTY